MANIYKNAFFNPTDTANTVIYATDTLTLCAKGASNGDDVLGSIKWYDVT